MKKETTFIYSLIDPRNNQIRYIGKSDNPNLRLLSHLKDNSKTYKVNWIKSVLRTGEIPELEILDEVLKSEWQFWEIFYYNYYKSLGFKLTNTAECGEGSTVISKPIIKIDIESGKIVETYISSKVAAKANNISNKRFTEILAGYKNFGNGVIKQVKQHKGFKYIREEDYDPNKDYRTTPRRSTPIQQLTLEGGLIKEFDRVNDAAEELNIPASQIVNCAKGNQKTCKGFIFKYIENN